MNIFIHDGRHRHHDDDIVYRWWSGDHHHVYIYITYVRCGKFCFQRTNFQWESWSRNGHGYYWVGWNCREPSITNKSEKIETYFHLRLAESEVLFIFSRQIQWEGEGLQSIAIAAFSAHVHYKTHCVIICMCVAQITDTKIIEPELYPNSLMPLLAPIWALWAVLCSIPELQKVI